MSFDGRFVRAKDAPLGSFVFARGPSGEPQVGFTFGWESFGEVDPHFLSLSVGLRFRELRGSEVVYLLDDARFSTAADISSLDFSGSFKPGQIASGPAGHFLVIPHNGEPAFVDIRAGLVASRGMPDIRGANSSWRIVQGSAGFERVLATS